MLFIHVMNISQVTNVYFVRQFRTLSANFLHIFLISVSKSRQLYFQLSDAPFIHQLARARAGLNQISRLKMTFILISASV